MSNLPASSKIVPATNAVAITASASLFAETRGIYIETAGSFTIQFADVAGAVTMTLPQGVFPFAIVKCTAGTGLWALY